MRAGSAREATIIGTMLDKYLPWLLVVSAVACTVWFWSNPHGIAPYEMVGDRIVGLSSSYLDWHPIRASGYPVFLRLIAAGFGSVEAVPKVQIFLGAVSLAFLGWCLRRISRTPFLALLPLCLPVAVPDLAGYQAMILPESLFGSLLCGMLGALIRFVERPVWQWAAVSALACGLVVTVRPAGLGLLPIWPIVLWFVWRRCAGQRARIVAAVVVPIALCLLADHLAWRAEHGPGPRYDQAGVHLFSKALMLELEPEPPPERFVSDNELARFVAKGREAFAPVRALVSGAPDLHTHILLLRNAENAAQYHTYQRVLSREADRLAERRGTTAVGLRAEAGWAAVTAAPVAWAKNALAHYWGMWIVYSSHDREFIRRLDAHLEPLRGSPILRDMIFLPREPSDRSGRRWVMLIGLFATAVALALVPWQRLRGGVRPSDNRLAFAGLCALMVHGYYLAVGLFAAVHMRYTYPMWPFVFVCCALLIDCALTSRIGSFRKRERRPTTRARTIPTT